MSRRDPIDVAVSHSAPVLLRPRRGAGLELARAPVVTPVTIPYAPAAGFQDRTATIAGETAVLHVRDGRFWRKACPGVPLAKVLEALVSRDPEHRLRGDLDDLWLDPASIAADGGSFTGFHPAVADAAQGRIALDLSDRASSGMAARMRDGVAHDGTSLWIAVEPPLLNMGGGALGEREHAEKHREPSFSWDKRKFMPNRPVALRASHVAIDEIVAYRNRPATGRRSLWNLTDAEARDGARKLAELTRGVGDPDADLARFARTIATGLPSVAQTVKKYRTRDRAKLEGEPLERIDELLVALMPHAALGSVDLIPAHDRSVVVDLSERLLRTLEPHLPRTGSFAITYVREHLDFIRHVVRPRLAQAIPEADAVNLASLSAP